MRYEDASHTSAFQGQGPIANDDTDQLAAGSKSSATGNLITGDGTQTGSAGADSATGGHITAIAGKGGEDSSFAGGKLSVMGEYGKLSVDAQGNYVYQANKGVENVRDRFTYTLADNNGATDTASLVVEIGKTPFAVKADAQQVVVGPDGVVTLPAGVELSDVHVVGRNLVVDMPDGTQMIIIDGAVFVPQLVLNGVEVPATNVAALLIGQEVQPAAGETPPSSGGNFAVPPPPLDPGVPLGDLIPPTEYTYKPPEPQPPLDIQDSEPEAGVATALLDDDAQQGGNPLSTTGDDPGGAVATGNLPGSGGDGNLTWELTGGGTVPAGLGFALSPQLNGDLWILQGGVHVITVHVDPTNGDYIVTQIAAIDHTAGGNENNEIFTLNYSVTDQDGDVATGTLTIDVDDDMPTVNVSAGPDADVILTTDDAQTIGAASDTAVTSANFSGVFGGTTVVFGADGAGPGSSSTYALAITGSNSGLASHGAAINLYVVGGVVVGSTAATAGAIDAGNTIFTVSTTNTGVVTLTQFQQIDHVVENPNGPPFADQFASLADGLVTLTRSETAVDGDGDQVTGSATVNIGANLHFTDDGPSVSLSAAAEPTLIVDESNFGGNAGPTSFASLFNFSFGADGPAASGSLQFNLGINPGATGLVDTLTGAAVVLSLESGQVIGRAGAGGPVVLVISVDANGNVSLDQQRAVIHSDPNDPNDDITFASDNLITLSATATDFDGDTGTIATPIAIAQDFHFLDDGPNANNDVDSIVGGSGPATGNVLTGVDSPGGDANATDGVADSSGADSPATVVGLASNNVPANVDNNAAGGFVVVGQYGTLTVNADGSYSYLRTDLSPGSKQDVFTYTMKDADGDTDTATLTINITDNAPIAGTVNATLDDDALANGNPGGVGDDSPDTSNLTGNLPGSGGDGTLTFSVGLGGAPAGFTYVSGGAGVVLIQQGGVTKITVTVNSDGSYTIVQNLPLDHAAGGNENNQSFALTYTVTDADGDPANGTININVDDDTPIATATLLTGTVDEDGVPGGIAGGPDDVAGAATSATGNVSSLFASGADTPLTYQLLGSFAGLPALTSGGVAVTYGVALNAGVYTLTASAGANTVFTFTLNATSGAYNFTLVDQIDHQTLNGLPGDDTENDLLIQLGSIIQATDHDGDTVVANANGLVITVDDDTPTAANDTDQVAAGGSSTTGNVITGAGTTSGAAGQDFPGADSPASIIQISGTGGTDATFSGGVLSIGGSFGTLDMDASGNYTYTRNGGSPGNVQDVFTYTYQDADGDKVTATLTITINDAAPIAGTVNATLDDDALANGNPGGVGDQNPDTSNLTGTLPGSGGDGTLTFGVLLTGAPAGFTYVSGGAGVVLIQQGGVTKITVTVNANGSYTIVQNLPIDHAAGGNENDQAFALTYTVTDADTDQATGTININVDDDTPIATATLLTGTVDEDGVPGGIAGGTGDVAGEPVSATGNVSGLFASGADTPLTYQLLGSFAGLPALTSNGVAVTYGVVLNAGVYTLTASAGANTVFTFTLNATTGAYNFTLVDQLDHAAGLNENDLTIALGSIIQATDHDGDTVVANANGLVITVDDDTPVANNDVDSISGGNGPATGNVLTGVDIGGGDANATDGVADQVGADAPGAITGLASNNVPANVDNNPAGGFVVNGQYGTLTVQANGNYSYTRTDGSPGSKSDVFTYTLTDADGDSTTATLTINITDNAPIAGTVNATLDDDALANGNPGGTGDQNPDTSNLTGNLPGSGGDGTLAFSIGLGGAPAGFSYVSGGAGVVLIQQGGVTKITVTVNSDGSYTIVQNLPLDHAAGGNENDQAFALTYTVTDADGDPANGTININVDDDTPVAAIATTANNVSVDESVGIQADSNDTTNAGVIALFAGVGSPVGIDTDLPQYATNANAVVTTAGSAVGADAPGSTVLSLNVSSAGVDSGLDTTDGQSIFLFKEGNLIVGRVGNGSGPAAFAIAIDQSGHISTVEYLSINHPNPANPDDVLSIADGAVLAVVTVTDADGDSATQNVAIGSHIQFQDSGPVMTAAQNMNIQNSGDVAHTAAFAFNLGADGANTSNDVITNVTGSATVAGVAVQNWTLTPGAETATTASYSFSFDYPIGGGNTAHETGTLVFDKAAGTYTIDLANPIQGVTTILQTATGTLFQGYEFGSSTLDGSQPAISVTQIQDLAGTANDIYVQFTSVAEPSSGTGDNNLEFSNWVPGADNPAPVNGGGDTTWNPGQLFNQTDSWVSTSNDANGVAGDTIQGGEVLDFNLVQGANPTGILAAPSTYAQASSMFLKFDGIGSSEDMIVVLKLYDTVAHTYTTVALMVQNSDIQKGPGSGPGIYSGITLDQNDGLIIIEPNDYQQGNTNLVIVGAQIAGSDEGLSGTAIDFNYGGVLGVASTGTQDFSTDVSDGPFKISSIGFTSLSTTPQNAQLDFNVTVTDGDGDSITQAISATVTPAIDSVSAATIPAANTTVAPVLLDLNGDGVQFLAADAGVRYDYNGDGVKEATAWAGPTDGILIHDANGNGTVDGAGEFVFGSGSVTDLQGLRAIYGDTLDANDADFAQFGVWQDANSNGVVDAGEYQSLTAAGIASINLVSDGVTYSAADGDVIVAGSSTYTSTDGSTGAVADASFYVGRSVDDEKALSSSTSNIALAAAIAAAGLAASQPAAASIPDEASHGQTVADTAASVGPAVVAAADDAAESRSALGNEVREAADDVPQAASSGHSDASADSSHSLDDSQASAPASSDEAAANDDQGPAAATADASPVAPTVAMVSAEALQAAGLDGNVQHGGSVEKIIVEALGHGNGNGAVDALLDAFHGGNGGGPAIANLASAPSGAVSAWDMASNGASAGANEMLMKVGAEMLHHDAVQPTHNG